MDSGFSCIFFKSPQKGGSLIAGILNIFGRVLSFRWMGVLAFWQEPKFFLERFHTAEWQVCYSGNNAGISTHGKEVLGNGNGF